MRWLFISSATQGAVPKKWKTQGLSLYIVMMVLMSGCGREEVIHLQSELEANRVLLGLRSEGIEARKVFTSKEWVIDVPDAYITQALRVLEDKRIFRDAPESAASASGADMFASRHDKEVRANNMVSASLANTLRVLPQVLDARVHIFQRGEDVFTFGIVPERTASVLLILRAKETLDEERVKDLVSQGAGLKRESVSVVSVPAFDNVHGPASSEPISTTNADSVSTPKKFLFSEFNLSWMGHPAILGALSMVLLSITFLIARLFFRHKNNRPPVLHPEMAASFVGE